MRSVAINPSWKEPTMSQEAMNKLAEAFEADTVFRGKFMSTASLKERAKVAVEHGYEVTAEDLKAWFRPGSDESELSDADLTVVAGGLGATTAANCSNPCPATKLLCPHKTTVPGGCPSTVTASGCVLI
jgi:predicted ribosomally synthesized peptide with nif11-like leader